MLGIVRHLNTTINKTKIKHITVKKYTYFFEIIGVKKYIYGKRN